MMKARIKATGEEITLAEREMSIFDTNGSLYYLSELVFISDEPNWEQRRYEIAKDVLAASFSTPMDGTSILSYVKSCVQVADILIEELKKRQAMRKKIIPKNCAHPVYHCPDGIDTVNCWKFLNEGFDECTYKNCECYKENKVNK